MQRWWCSDDNKNGRDKVPKSKRSPSKLSTGIKKWKFSVVITSDLNNYEKIAVVGNCEQLGEWDPDHSVLLEKQDGEKLDKERYNFPRKLFLAGETCFCTVVFLFFRQLQRRFPRTSWMFFI
jgi:hypothetical protein